MTGFTLFAALAVLLAGSSNASFLHPFAPNRFTGGPLSNVDLNSFSDYGVPEVRYVPHGIQPSHPMYKTFSRADYGKGMTPHLVWYIPTFKCDAKYYCRAELIAYQEFQGKIVVQVGYSIRNFNAPSVPISDATRARIAATTDAEIHGYFMTLGRQMYKTYPTPHELCPTSPADAAGAFKKVIASMVTNCMETTNYVCEAAETATTCT